MFVDISPDLGTPNRIKIYLADLRQVFQAAL